MTIKAWRIISQAPVIAYPKPNGKDSLARRIAAPFIPENVTELPIELPMCGDREHASEAYDTARPLLAAHLDAGRDVAFLCEGDPFFYGSFMHLFARMAAGHETVVVPGVTSLTASAAVIGRPLASRNDLLKVLPAPLGNERLRSEIENAESVAIIKVGQHFERIKSLLVELRLADRAIIVERATSREERIFKLADVAKGERHYFSTILIYRGGEEW
jgi:precorrin-2/cobalt-factor-2 C20-methyltransferase